MSSYMKSGARQQKVLENKRVKKHVKGFYQTLGKMEDVAQALKHLDVEFTEDNINEYVLPILGRELDSMEKFLVLGKLFHGKEENKS